MNQEDFFVVVSAPTTNDIKEMISRKGISVSALADQSKSQLMKEYEYTLIDYYNDQLEILSDEFDVTFEGRFYRDVITEVDGQTYDYRVIKQTDSVNLTYILDGELPIKNDEVAIFKTYADANGLSIGDPILLNDKSFVISAFVAVPDYIYPIFNYDNPLYEPALETIAIVTETAYEVFNEKQWVLYSGYFNHDVDDLESVVSQISDAHGVSYAMSKDINVRISTVNAHLSSNQLLSMTFTGLLLMMSVIVIVLVMKKRINAERVQIGVLKAIGYSSFQIAVSYVTYPLLATIIGSLIGFFLGIGVAAMLTNTYMTSYIVPLIRFYFKKELVLGGIIYPMIVVGFASFVILLVLLKDEPLKLMRESSYLKISTVSKWLMKFLKPFDFETRFKYSLAFRNIGKLLSLFSIVLVASRFLVFSSITFKSVENIVDKAFKNVNYSYQIKYNKLINKPFTETETPFLEYMVEPILDEKNTAFCLYGIDPYNFINPLYNAAGEKIYSFAKDGVVINEFFFPAYLLTIGG